MNKYKVRTRFNIVDIAMLCDTLRKTILGTRISNIYDCQPTSMSPRSYIIKLSGTPIGAPSSSSSLSTTTQSTSGKEDDAILNTKHMLLLDPPCRMHVTEYVRPKKDVPSILSLKLRKYIRGKRLEKITQLGIDRVIQLTFGVGESSFNLIIELYAQGNIVLTDSAYTILAVLRHHEYGDGASIAVKSTYPLSFVKHLPDDSISSFSLIEKTIEKITTEISLKEANDAKKEDVESEEKGTNEDNDDGENDKSQQSKKKGQKKGGNNNKGKQQQQQQQKKKVDPCYTVLDIIRNIVDFGTHFNNEIVSSAKSIQDPNRNLLKTPLTEDEKADLAASLSAHFLKFKRMHAGLESLTPGYVLLRPSEEKKDEKVEEKAEEKSAPADKSGDSDRFYDFAPIEYSDCEGIERVEFANFDIALDRFFTQLEVAQMARQQANLESTMGKKLEKLKRDQEERIAGLEDAAERLKKNAMLIEYNIPLVDQAINELRAVIASGLPWTEIELMVKTLKKTDPTSIANIIHHLVLRENRAFLLLSEPSEDDEAEHDATSVPIDLSLSAHGNIEACYTERSGWLSKAKKTTDVSDQVIEKAEKKYKNDLKKARANASVNPYSGSGGFLQVRKKFWFEKFNWFVSAEGLVVVSGKDAQQNETLYKRYMRQNDVYVHADIHGAATCIIRSRQDVNGGAIGPVTLEQAGRFAMCRSNAWSSKLVTSAWWVYPSQVSKSAPTGEYLTTGSFMIRGKKNFLPPHQLVMGFGLLFLLDPSSLEAHKDDALAGSALDSTQVPSSSLLSSSSSSALLSDDDAEEEQQQQQQQKEEEDENPKDSSNDDKASVITFVESDMPEPTAKEEDWSSMAESDILSNEPSTLSIGDSGKQQQSKVEESESRMEDLEEEEEEEVEVVEEEKSSSAVGVVRHQQPKSKYFDDEDETNNDDAENGSNDVIDELMKSSGSAGKKDRKPKMSAHARRALKKGIDPTQKSESEETDKKKQQQQQQKKKKGGRKGRGGDDNDSDDDSTVSKQEPPAKPKPKLSKAKLKKLKKYADQDEEDRRMRMMLIGHAPKDTKEDNDEDNIEDIDLLTGNTTKKAQKKQQQQQKQAKSCFICGSKDHYARDCPKKKLEEQKAAIESENAMKSAKKVEADNIDVDDDDDDDNDGAAGNLGGAGAGGNYSDGIERLTAIPRSDDILLHAIPVCAPYDALQNYKYKVKLTPGHLKRGKAVDSAIQLFLKQQDVTEQEKRLIKAIPHDDLLQCMLSDVTVAGGQASARLKKLKKK